MQRNQTKDIQETFNKMVEIIKLIGETDNLIIKETNDLKMILLNLKIEDAHIREGGRMSGITPIADNLEKIIKSIHDNVQKLMTENKGELDTYLRDIGKYIREKE